jgi:hypothetical protein
MARELEHAEQCALFRWAWSVRREHPELEWMFAVPNGYHRDIRVARKVKAAGAKAGIPDVALPVPRGPYHGLYLELKVGRNKPTEEQRKWLEHLGNVGYFATWCTGWEAARDVIVDYLNLEGGGHEPENNFSAVSL